jgi:hypothetical protein
LIVEYVAARHGGDRLLGTEEFRQVVLALGDPRVVSLKEKSDSHDVLCELMSTRDWKPQVKLGGSVGRRVDFYKRNVQLVVEIIASTPVWISATITKMANIKNGVEGLCLVLSLDEMTCSFDSVLSEIDSVIRVLRVNHPLLVLGCRSLSSRLGAAQ